METIHYNFSGFIILLVLGLRHGLDPDHITVIDGYTYRLHEKKSPWARWVGTLFTLGHGIMVTLIALSLSLVRSSFQMPVLLELIVDWIPVVMLLIMGISNVISFRQSKERKTVGLRSRLLPNYFNDHLNPFTVILTGIIFGFIFDTSSQIAAFGYTVSVSSQSLYAVIGGVAFSLGLIITGTGDSFLLSKLLKTFDQKKIQSHRFKLNVLITAMCFIIPGYKIICHFKPHFEMTDFQNNVVGLCFISIILSLYAELYIRYKIRIKKMLLQEPVENVQEITEKEFSGS